MASIRKRGRGYQITVSNGRDIHDKQILETTTWVPDPDKTEKQNQKALDAFAIDFERKVKSGMFLQGEKITFLEFSERWMHDYATLQLDETTTSIYQILLDTHILPAIGHLKLSKIQPVHMNKLYKEMSEHRLDGKDGGYSPTTIKRVHALISSILSTAAQWNVILSNPCERVKPPKQLRDTSDIQYFTEEETAAFLQFLSDGTNAGEIKLQYNIFYQIAIFCGLRRGESIALLWSDIDFEAKTMSITKSTSIVKGKAVTKSTKTKSSVRTISSPDHILELLREYRAEYDSYRYTIGSLWAGEDHIFIQWNGVQMYPSTPSATFKKLIHSYNETHEDKLPDIRLHDLRHTSATLLISQNVDVKTVSSRLGHAQTSTTMNIYAHALKKKDVAAAEALENLLIKRA